MNSTTRARQWTREPSVATVLRYDNPAKSVTARIVPQYHNGYSWTVTQFGRVLGSGTAPRLAGARTEANLWLDTAEEMHP